MALSTVSLLYNAVLLVKMQDPIRKFLLKRIKKLNINIIHTLSHMCLQVY